MQSKGPVPTATDKRQTGQVTNRAILALSAPEGRGALRPGAVAPLAWGAVGSIPRMEPGGSWPERESRHLEEVEAMRKSVILDVNPDPDALHWEEDWLEPQDVGVVRCGDPILPATAPCSKEKLAERSPRPTGSCSS